MKMTSRSVIMKSCIIVERGTSTGSEWIIAPVVSVT